MDMDQQTLTPVCDGVMFGGYLVGTLFIILRLVCRLRLSGAGLWWDDYVLFLGCVPSMGTFILYVACHHIEDLGYDALTPFLINFYAIQIVYTVTMFFIKSSILLVYWRIFAISARKSIIVMQVLVTCWFIAGMAMDAFSCSPISYFWNRVTEEGFCVNNSTHYLSLSTINIVLDCGLLALPLPHILRLQMPFTQRLVLVAIFMVGGFATATSIVRIVILMQQNTVDDPDVTYDLTGVFIWSILELTVGYVCACLTTLKPIYDLARSRFLAIKKTRRPSRNAVFSSYSSLEAGRAKDGSKQISAGDSGLHDSKQARNLDTMRSLAVEEIELELARH